MGRLFPLHPSSGLQPDREGRQLHFRTGSRYDPHDVSAVKAVIIFGFCICD